MLSDDNENSDAHFIIDWDDTETEIRVRSLFRENEGAFLVEQ
jgi:hypothetical protein